MTGKQLETFFDTQYSLCAILGEDGQYFLMSNYVFPVGYHSTNAPCMYVCMYVCVYIYIYIYIYMVVDNFFK